MDEIRQKPQKGEVWTGGGYRVLITGTSFGRVRFVRLNGEMKGATVACERASFLAAYAPEGSDG